MRPALNVLWNLFLALVPVLLASAIARGARGDLRHLGRVRWWLWVPLALVWLVFLPNSCYLLTEWRHYLETVTQSPIYQEAHLSGEGRLDFLVVTVFYLFYSGAGLLAFFLAVWPLDRLTRRRLGWGGALLRPLIFPLCALGVYLGLMSGRFNSWDLLHPARLHQLWGMLGQILQRPFLLGMIALFGAALWLFYVLFDIWMDGLAWRLAHRRAAHAAKQEQQEKETSHAAA